MTGTVTALTKSADGNGTELTRFNALRHGILSRYTVLPWEDEEEYGTLVAALAAEHAPHGADRGASGGGAGGHPVAQTAAPHG